MTDMAAWRREFEGEVRANLLRAVGVSAFYLIELANYRTGTVDRAFHMAMTALAAAWLVSAWGVFAFLRRRVFPPPLMYLSTGLDVVYLTAVLLVADGPRSPLVVVYMLLPVLAALRLSLPLVRFAAAGAVGGYLFLLGHARWFRPETAVPRYHEAIVLLSLALCGVLLGQILRRSSSEAA